MKLFKIGLLSLSLASLAACHPNGTATTSSAPGGASDTVASVNGTPISRGLYDYYTKGALQGKDAATLTQAQKEELLDNLVRGEIVAQQADKDGLAKDAETLNALELARLSALQQSFVEKFSKENKPTDDELKKEYDAQVAKLQLTEYHVAHILVTSEDAANKVLGQLGKGAKFDELAKKVSTDPSKDQGGDLSWMTADHMPDKAFSDVVVTLKPGEVAHAPVQTRYGWHVIKLLETRPLAPPPFDQVKDRVVNIVLGKKYKAYVDGLLAKAQIDKKI